VTSNMDSNVPSVSRQKPANIQVLMVSIRIAQQHLPIYNHRPTAQSLSIAALYFAGASARHGYRRWPECYCEIDHRRTAYD
jgi:hypothetical protein